MFLHINSQFEISKPKRLIFRDPEKSKPIDKTPLPPRTSEKLPKVASAKDDLLDTTAKELATLTETTKQDLEKEEAAKKLNNDLHTKSKKYYEILSSPKKPENLEKMREKIESDEVSMIDLQGGWEFLGLKDKDQHEKYARLAEIYLKKETDQFGQEIFTVNKELDNIYKTKYGIGAGDLLPPSITEVEITDLKGNQKRGRREIKNNRVGYYEISTGIYIPIFGGYTIRPLNFLDENSKEYETQLETEKLNYEKKRDAANALDTGSTTLLDSQFTETYNKSPSIGSLKSLRTTTEKTLKGRANPQETLEIVQSQKDLQRIEALLDHFNIRLSADSEISGGLYLTTLDGKGASMLGWNDECETKEKDLRMKLLDTASIQTAVKELKDKEELPLPEGVIAVKDSTEKNGYYLKTKRGEKIKNVASWCIQEAAKLSKPSNTVNLIKALQNGGTSYKFLNYEFSGNYELELSHLDTLYRLAEKDREELTTILETQKKPREKINSIAFIREIFKQKTLPTGMSMEQAVEFINKNRSRLGFLLGDKGQKYTLRDFYAASKRTPPLDNLDYRWDSLTQYLDYPVNGGKKCCAFAVSTFLGLGEDGGSTRGKKGSVRSLVAGLLSGNKSATMKEGLVFGFENYEKGDVLVFKGCKKYAEKEFAHVALVRDKLDIEVYDSRGRYIGKEEYLILIDDGEHLQATIIPVKRVSYTQNYLAKALQSPSSRDTYLKKYPQLAEVFSERSSVRARANAGWWGDALTGQGNIAFGIRTTDITKGFRVAKT